MIIYMRARGYMCCKLTEFIVCTCGTGKKRSVKPGPKNGSTHNVNATEIHINSSTSPVVVDKQLRAQSVQAARSPLPSPINSSSTSSTGGANGDNINNITATTSTSPRNLKVFTYAELKSATKNFRPDTVLGEGGFGRVFKGWVDEKTYAPSKVGVGIPVAVKKSNPDSEQGLNEWQVYINIYSILSSSSSSS